MLDSPQGIQLKTKGLQQNEKLENLWGAETWVRKFTTSLWGKNKKTNTVNRLESKASKF